MSFHASAPATPPPVAPPPPPPNPASAPVQASGARVASQAKSAAGGGFSGTLLTGSNGAPDPSTAKATLGSG